MEGPPLSLTSREALHILYREIESLLQQFKHSQKKRNSKSWIRDSIHHSSHHTTINWISISLLLWCALSLILAYFLGDYSKLYLVQSVLILFFTTLSISLELYDNHLRHNEIPRRVEHVLKIIKKEAENVKWQPENYPSLFMPTSPCITMQWTFRDGKLVNLPYSLLVKDDVILVKPGQISPGYCECLEKHSDQPLLHAKEVYAPQGKDGNLISSPTIRKPLKSAKYKLLETPYLSNLKIMLEQALDRPSTQLTRQQHILLVEMVQRIILPIAIIIFYALSALKYLHLKFDNDVALFLLYPTNGILPLLPIIFPIVWNLANYIGLARLQAIFFASKIVQGQESFSLEEEADQTIVEHIRFRYKWMSIITNFFAILWGDPEIMARSANILHVLGSVSALGCVDKKGVLSSPNPTAEKVFFLHNRDKTSSSSSLNIEDLDSDSIDGNPSKTPSGKVEVLDLTHDHHDPFKLQFDDPKWNVHMSSLKPLGLAILLNTCNPATEKQYSNFCSHITCEAQINENLVPVSNRRCLCELAKIIGFVDEARKIFNMEQKLCTFRHLQPETVRRDNKYARSLQMSNSKLKVPFPHMFAVVVREISTNAMQLLSEGTADILLDACVDYWDGKDLRPLTVSDRKRIQDFYQRTSLTSYCTAFSYRPLNRAPAPTLASTYLELPSDSKHLYLGQRSPSPIQNNGHTELDSLIYGCAFEAEEVDANGCFQMQCNQIFIGMVSMQYQVLTDMVHLIEQLERACIRFVHFSKENELRSRVFSEKMGLESGWNCHISLLSERTRGDNAKSNSMVNVPITREETSSAVPSGENASVVQQSNLENSKAISFSAPSAINIDQTVKFEREVTSRRSSNQNSINDSKNAQQQDSSALFSSINTSHDWQSMSCLTDSTDRTAPVNFDMSNRAKLPRGIDKIRPHIELIDNVPLLVSLFTDCTPSATREMLHIMQDYGEIVCIMGSVSNCENTGIFMQADANVAVEPMYPQVCQRRLISIPYNGTSPMDLARQLNSLPCSLCIKREDPINLYHLIMESRHFVTSIWNAVQFWICCCATVTGVQIACSIALIPSPFTTGQVLWLISIVIPILSASLIALPVDADVMKRPLGKNDLAFNWNIMFFISWCYGLKFIPTILTVLTSFWGILTSHCHSLCEMRNCTCFLHHTPIIGSDGNESIGWADQDWTLNSARLLILLLIVTHFVAISIGFVHRGHLIIQKLPLGNRLWIVCAIVFVLLQSVYTVVCYHIHSNGETEFELPVWILVLGFISPFVVLVINETVKHQEIGVNTRFQKRARLDFGTKLGMNSPF
ncbi:transmembrane protein 94 isoform X2 [Coccinella septempunctata]|uniref:transmembrane protein 94 isoform X2 n=1 Tax=Coccinella septempunctata TaxID=41139 RepID=UPI001D0783BC|nr:transmembrane protein 94 isoform X2 [Coccinella septempunctata]